MSTEEGARFLYRMADIQICGLECTLKKPTDPTNIVWECHKEKVKWQNLKIFGILAFTLILDTIITVKLIQHKIFFDPLLKKKYENSVNCATLF